MAETNNTPGKLAFQTCLFHFFIAGVLGVLMRYKILYPLPQVEQAHLLHAHSHFVFFAWITLALFTILVRYLLPAERGDRTIYRYLFWAMLLTGWGMLFTFLYQGYGALSITFSTLSLICFYVFTIVIWRDLKFIKANSYVTFLIKIAMLSYVFSSLGTFALGYLSSVEAQAILVKSAIYFFLHFQYNGWFTFCIAAILLHLIHQYAAINRKQAWTFSILLFLGLIPGYFLSVIGYYPFGWIRLCSLFAVLVQFGALIYLLQIVRKSAGLLARLPKSVRWLWGMALFAFVMKTVLQAASLVPDLARFTFTFRPLVIGYLHLVFLCLISFFILGYFLFQNSLKLDNLSARMGLCMFVVFVWANELLLFVQSCMAYFNQYHGFYNKWLLYVSIGIVLGLGFLIISQRRIYWGERKQID